MTLSAAIARAEANRKALAIDTDVERILRITTVRLAMPPGYDEDGNELPPLPGLPASVEVDVELDATAEAERWTRALRKHPGAPPLKPEQGIVLTMATRSAQVGEPHGCFCAMPVGSGKTLTSLLVPTVVAAERPLLLIPPSMRDQLREDIAMWQQHYHFVPPKYIAYSDLSMPTATSFLEYMQPDMLIADECFVYETLVTTDVGDVPIGDVVEGGVGTQVLSYNIETGECEWKDIVRRIANITEDVLVRVWHEHGMFVCTRTHKVLTEFGYVKAGDLEATTSLHYVQGDIHAVGGTASSLFADVFVGGEEKSACDYMSGVRGPEGRGAQRKDDTSVLFQKLCIEEEDVPGGASRSCVLSSAQQDEPRESHSFQGAQGSEARGNVVCELRKMLSDNKTVPTQDMLTRVSLQARGREDGTPTCETPCRHEVRCVWQSQGTCSDVFPRVCCKSEDREVSIDSQVCRAGSMGTPTETLAEASTKTDAAYRQSAEDYCCCGGSASVCDMRKEFRRDPSCWCEGSRYVLPRVCPQASWRKDEQKGAAQSPEESSQCRAHAQKQSHEDSCQRGEDACEAEGAHVPSARWERSDHETATGTSGCSAFPGSDGVRGVHVGGPRPVSEPAYALQSGSGVPGAATCHRSGRQDTQVAEMEVPRSSKDFHTQRSRVVRVEVLERGDRHGSASRHSDDSRHVYDLEVADNHNYLANRVVVSNCHMLRNKTSARVKRVLRLLKENPETRVVLLSGTITGKTLHDHAHLLEICLRDRTPLPLHYKTLEQWASVLDPDGEPDYDAIHAMWPLAATYAKGPEDFSKLPRDVRQRIAREGYRLRFTSIPGVITSAASSVACSLYLVRRRPHVPAVVTDALKNLPNMPDVESVDEHGEELVDAMAIARAAGYISAGFFYRWDWSCGGRRSASKDEYDVEWTARRSEWARAVRDALKHSHAGYDSEFLVKVNAAKGKGGDQIVEAYKKWHELRPEDDTIDGVCKSGAHEGERRWCDRNPPPIQAVWLSEFLLDDVDKWVRAEHKAGAAARKAAASGGTTGDVDTARGRAILWYSSKAMEQALKARGYRTYGAGTPSPPDHEDIVACSILVHGKGKNLQGEADRGPGGTPTRGWSRNVIIEPPSSGQTWEQLIGRTHRQGQRADEVVAVIYQHTSKLVESLLTATSQAKYIQQTQGVQQKLLYGTWTNEER